jgi:hypothetical protein
MNNNEDEDDDENNNNDNNKLHSGMNGISAIYWQRRRQKRVFSQQSHDADYEMVQAIYVAVKNSVKQTSTR